MKTQIDIRISYKIVGTQKSLHNADLIYLDFQKQFKEKFPEAELNFVCIAKSEIKDKEVIPEPRP